MSVFFVVHDLELGKILVGFAGQGGVTNRAGEIDGITFGHLEAEAPVTNDLVVPGLGIHQDEAPLVTVMGNKYHADVGI